MAKHLGVFAAFALAVTVIACGSEGGAGSESNGEDAVIGADGFPVGPDGKPLSTKLDGQYEISTAFDLTTVDALPSTLTDTLKAFSEFEEHPSQTIVDLMDVANVPVANILNSIPGPIRPSVLGFIDDYIVKALYDKVPVLKKITSLLDDVGSLATKFELVSKLDLPTGDAFGKAGGKHAVTGVGYQWDGKRHVFEVPQDLRAKFPDQEVAANAVPLAPRSKDLELGRLQLGEHKFSVPMGSFVVRAVDKLATDRFGADLRGSLGKVLDCDKVADAVSERCVGIGPAQVCVGHKTEIKKICTTGLDLLVSGFKGALKGFDFALAVKIGVAQMWDPPAADGALDAAADRLDVGFWSGSVKTLNDDHPILATFTGRRLGAGEAPASKDAVK